ncbi:MAG: helix-turn-helix domain-containing protein [Bifidobacteriaceae bacterium]|nr:helix-turn-helix domain-containing protein [Bifidobacteriaceae bacterium]
MDERLLTAAEVAEILNVPRATLYDWTYMHVGIDYIKLGKQTLRYKYSDVMDYIERCTVKVVRE